MIRLYLYGEEFARFECLTQVEEWKQIFPACYESDESNLWVVDEDHLDKCE